MNDCVFCKIIKKEIPSNIIYENEKVLAFDDINPVAPVHTLIVPKKHIETFMDLVEEDIYEYITEVHMAIKEVAKIKGVAEKGFRIIANCKEDGGQLVRHLHYHLIGGRKLGSKIN